MTEGCADGRRAHCRRDSHPAEARAARHLRGFVRITYLSPQSIAAGGLPPPFSDRRPMGSALYFMVTPTAPVRLHRIRNDQLYHYYLGDPLEVLLLHSD